MGRLPKYILLLFVLYSCSSIYCQYPGSGGSLSGGSFNPTNTSNNQNSTDTTQRDPLVIYRTSLSLNDQKIKVDTVISNVHLIEPFYKSNFISSNLGSENSASVAPTFSSMNKVGVELGHFQYQNLIDDLGISEVYDVNRSLWSIAYGKGYNINSSNLNVDFYRRFNRNILLNFNYDSFSDQGWLRIGENRVKNIDLKLYQDQGHDRRKSYLVYRNTDVNEMNSQTMANGQSSSSKLKQIEYLLGNKMKLRDSLLNGSLFLINKIGYTNNYFEFSDDSVTEEEGELYLPVESTNSTIIKNGLRKIYVFNQLQYSSNNFDVTFGMNYSNKEYSTVLDTSNFNEIEASILVQKDLFKKSRLSSQVNIGLLDASGDMNIDIIMDTPLRIGENKLGFKFNSLTPYAFFKNAYSSNGLIWSNEFSNSVLYELDVLQSIPKHRLMLRARFSMLENSVVINPEGSPTQLTESINTIAIQLSKSLNWKFIESDHNILYQHITTESIKRPPVQLTGSIRTTFLILKEKMLSEIGFHYYILPDHQINSYNPALGLFYNEQLQRSSGNIVIINPYYSFKVDNFNFFIKANNVLSRFRGVNFSLVDGYNLYDFRIMAGVKWRLLD